MNYKIDRSVEEKNPKIIYFSIIFDHFKINIIERYVKSKYPYQNLFEVFIKVRSL